MLVDRQMRLLKIKLLSKILPNLGLPYYFRLINTLEIVHIYQYDRYNFFSLNKILLKSQQTHSIEKELKDLFKTQSIIILEKRGPEILCIIKQRKSEGFWPALLSGAWALIPPIVINPHTIVFSIISKDEEELSKALNQLNVFQPIEVLATRKIDETTAYMNSLSPKLTNRQHEIISYAQRHGFFDIPKKTSLVEIAENFGISPSAAGNHIQKAEKILMKYFFG